MKCPHCQVMFHDKGKPSRLIEDKDGTWYATSVLCPNCQRFSLFISIGAPQDISRDDPFPPIAPHMGEGPPPPPPKRLGPFLVWPRHASFSPAPPEVPLQLAEDYNEARTILELSPKASAALARRCLQGLLRNHAGVRHGSLSGEIQQVLESGQLPSHLADSIDAIRNIGDFAAHAIMDRQAGEITTVEPHEAKWILDVLEELFDFYLVQPERTRKKREALNEKLKKTGKPPLK